MRQESETPTGELTSVSPSRLDDDQETLRASWDNIVVDTRREQGQQVQSGQNLPTILSSGPDLSTIPENENDEEKRRRAGLLPLLPPPGMGANALRSQTPMVQGTPHFGGVPQVQGTPQFPGGPLGQGAGFPQAAPSRIAQPGSLSEPLHHGYPHVEPPPTGHQGSGVHHQPNHRPACLTTVIASVLVIAGIISALIFGGIFNTHGAGSPVLIITSGLPVPGGSVTLHGSNFPPGGAVTITGDGHPLLVADQARAVYSANLASALQVIAPQTMGQRSLPNATVTVRSDGSFDVTVTIPPQWNTGRHTIQAAEQVNGASASASVNLTVQPQGTTPTPTDTPAPSPTPSPPPTPTPSPTAAPPPPTPTPTTAPPPKDCVTASPAKLSFTGVAGQSAPPAQAVTISNCGPTGAWSASVATSDGAAWLSIDSSGSQLNAGASQTLNASVSAANLRPGSYQGTITVTLGTSAATVAISFTVQLPPCIKVDQPSIKLAAISGQSTPASQVVTITNCGAPGTWSVAFKTDDGASWLSTDSNGGPLNTNGTQPVTISASSAKLQAATQPYHGVVTFTMGTSTATVDVYFTVSFPPPG